MFLHKNLFFQYLLLFQSQSCLLESTAAIFRQSAGYVCLPIKEEIKKLTYQHIVQQTTKRIKQSTLEGP